MATIKENLIAAKALIADPAHWGKEEFEPRPGCYCALGAVAKAAGVDTTYVESSRENYALERALNDLHDGLHNWLGVIDFNDDPKVTHPEVVALFDRAIAAQDEVAS